MTDEDRARRVALMHRIGERADETAAEFQITPAKERLVALEARMDDVWSVVMDSDEENAEGVLLAMAGTCLAWLEALAVGAAR